MRDRKASLEDYRIAEEYYAQRAAKASRRAQLARVARTLAEANQPTERQAVSRKAVNPHCGACLRGNCRSAACAEFRGIAEAGGMT